METGEIIAIVLFGIAVYAVIVIFESMKASNEIILFSEYYDLDIDEASMIYQNLSSKERKELIAKIKKGLLQKYKKVIQDD
ncbi:hypothetical protein CFT13S00388_09120 [Campylobacter fetus subsp. testudinum]|uniref:hypothetical protein n=1 Tax=Campylobacter fetus TaxID=196 RepID=UPI0008187D57|nr:hypothetical protein [Campylobacter fetus]OCR86438.1 hypothetical protein CFT13S00388_09120 [Campylobacter fetus subsp. testudinum]